MKHRFFVPPERADGETVTFSDGQTHQIESVLRLRAGDRVRVFDGRSPLDRVVELCGHGLGRVVGEVAHAPEPRTRLVACPALLQRDKFEIVLQKLTEIGAAAIQPVFTARGLVRQAPDEHRRARWEAILREAAEQCGRGVVPALLPAVVFEEGIAHAEGLAIVAYERELRHGLREALAGAPKTVSVFVGPEGGFSAEEAECARAAGAHLVTLGPRLLRTETASPLLAALVLYELGDLSSADDDDRS